MQTWGAVAYWRGSIAGNGSCANYQNATMPANVRVEIKDMRGLALTGSGWTTYQTESQYGIGGGAYPITFSGSCSGAGASLRTEPDGGWSWKLPADQHCVAHFWVNQWPRAGRVANMTCTWTTLNARVIKDSASGPDNTGVPFAMVDTGMDVWQSDSVDNYDNGVGTFRLVGPDWRPINQTSCTAAQLSANPPPL